MTTAGRLACRFYVTQQATKSNVIKTLGIIDGNVSRMNWRCRQEQRPAMFYEVTVASPVESVPMNPSVER